jgi:hypothetical protein
MSQYDKDNNKTFKPKIEQQQFTIPTSIYQGLGKHFRINHLEYDGGLVSLTGLGWIRRWYSGTGRCQTQPLGYQ